MTKIERNEYLEIVAMNARRARQFFGAPEHARIEDGGAPTNPENWKPGARVWRVYLNWGPKK